MSVMTGLSAGPTTPGAMPDTVVPLTAIHPVARVDLMPPEIAGQRRFRRAQLVMATALVVSLLAAGTGFLLSQRSAAVAQQGLLAEQAQTTQLTAEAATYSEVPAVLGAIERSRTALTTVMARDVAWYPYLYQVSLAAPPSVWFEQISFTALAPDAVPTDPLAPLLAADTKKVLYQLYAKRLASMALQPKDPDWDGAIRFETK